LGNFFSSHLINLLFKFIHQQQHLPPLPFVLASALTLIPLTAVLLGWTAVFLINNGSAYRLANVRLHPHLQQLRRVSLIKATLHQIGHGSKNRPNEIYSRKPNHIQSEQKRRTNIRM
jgi:hypothetical protein